MGVQYQNMLVMRDVAAKATTKAGILTATASKMNIIAGRPTFRSGLTVFSRTAICTEDWSYRCLHLVPIQGQGVPDSCTFQTAVDSFC